jgi:hypothetical protein
MNLLPRARSTFHLALALLLPALTMADWQPLESPAGPSSLAPGLAVTTDGGAVLSWLEAREGGHVLQFAEFDGEVFGPVGEIARGDDWFANWADMPGIHVRPNGHWLAHWLVKSGPATYAYDVVMARSADGGQSWSESFSPHDDGTRTEHGFVSYFDWSEQSAGVVWLDGRETAAAQDPGHGQGHDPHYGHGAGAMTLRTATVSIEGAVTDGVLLDAQVCDCCQTAAAMTDQGPVVIYRGRDADEIRDIWVVRQAQGRWTEPELLHADGWQIGGCPVNGPALIARGELVVAAWFTMAEGVPRVRVSVSRDAGKSFSSPLSLGEGSAMGRVDLSWMPGGVLLSWMDQGGADARIVLTRLSHSLEIIGESSPLALSAARISGFPRLATLADGRVLVAWTGADEDRRGQIQVALYGKPVAR